MICMCVIDYTFSFFHHEMSYEFVIGRMNLSIFLAMNFFFLIFETITVIACFSTISVSELAYFHFIKFDRHDPIIVVSRYMLNYFSPRFFISHHHYTYLFSQIIKSTTERSNLIQRRFLLNYVYCQKVLVLQNFFYSEVQKMAVGIFPNETD